MKHPNSILIIEDAEGIILDRKQRNFLSAQAVSNLLNLSDGLLGDGIRQQIICTFKFDKLSVENARRLCVELGVPDDVGNIREPMTLAEIYVRKHSTRNNIDEKIKRLFQIEKQLSIPFSGLYS
jgi:hypothetical protein